MGWVKVIVTIEAKQRRGCDWERVTCEERERRWVFTQEDKVGGDQLPGLESISVSARRCRLKKHELTFKRKKGNQRMLLQNQGAGDSGRFVRETWKPVGTGWTRISTTLVQVSSTVHSGRVSVWEPQQAVVLWWASVRPPGCTRRTLTPSVQLILGTTPAGLLWYCTVLVLSWLKVYTVWDLWSGTVTSFYLHIFVSEYL